MSKSLSLTNSKDLICNSISLILGNDVINLQDLFLLKTDAIKDIIGLAPEDLNSISEIAASINNNTDFAQTINELLKLKASTIYVDNELSKKNNITDVFNKIKILELMELKADQSTTYSIENINSIFYNKINVDEKLKLKSNILDIFNKLEINNLLNLKTDKETSLTKIQIENLYYNKLLTDQKLNLKCNIVDFFNKLEITELLKLSYSITEVNNLFHNKSYVDEKLLLKCDLVNFYNKSQILEFLKLKSDKNVSYSITEINNLFHNKEYLNEKLNLKSDLTYTNNTFYNKTYLNSVFNNIYNKLQVDNIIKEYYNKDEINLYYYNKVALDDLKLISKSKLDETLLTYMTKNNINSELNKKSDIETTYNKSETHTYINKSYYTKQFIIDNFVNITTLNTYYSKEQIDVTFNEVENKFYFKSIIDEALKLKLDQTAINSYYSKGNIDEILKNYNNSSEQNEAIKLKLDKSTIDAYYSKLNIQDLYINRIDTNDLLDLKLNKIELQAYYSKIQNNNLLDLKFDKSTISNYYSKSNINQMLVNYFNKNEINDKNDSQFNILIDQINLKSNISSTYSKSQVNIFLSNYSEINDVFTKQDINAKNYISFSDLVTNLNNYYSKETLNDFKFVGLDQLNTELLKFYNKTYINTAFSNLYLLLFMSSNILNLKSGSDGMQILDSNNNVLIKASNANISFNKSINLTTDEINTSLNIKNTRDAVASLYIGTPSVIGQIFCGIGALHVITHSNHGIVFKTNAGSDSMIIEAWGGISIHKDLYSNANTYVKNAYVQGDFSVKNINSPGTSLLKLKSGLATQILTADDSLIFEANDASVAMLRSATILTQEFNTNLTIQNLTPDRDYASLYLKANGVEGQLYTGGKRLNISTNNAFPIIFATDRFVHGDSMKIETNGDVNVFTRFSHPSDSKLKDNQIIGNYNEIQDIFDNIDVYTYERNDLKNQKRVGFIAQDVEKAISKYPYYKHIVGESTIKLKHDDDDEVTVLTLDYARLNCILWMALKNSNKRIDALEKRMAAMETK